MKTAAMRGHRHEHKHGNHLSEPTFASTGICARPGIATAPATAPMHPIATGATGAANGDNTPQPRDSAAARSDRDRPPGPAAASRPRPSHHHYRRRSPRPRRSARPGNDDTPPTRPPRCVADCFELHRPPGPQRHDDLRPGPRRSVAARFNRQRPRPGGSIAPRSDPRVLSLTA